jgi:hypothetical protein
MTGDLAVWLLEQIAIDEGVVKEQGETHTLACIGRASYEWDHACRCGFADRMPAECDAKRRIIQNCQETIRSFPEPPIRLVTGAC